MNIKELKINCLGASNTKVTVALDAEGNKVVHRDVNYPSLLAARLGCTVRNYGVSGTNIAVSDGREDSYFERKLEKIKKITGLDLREFEHAIIFKVALMVEKYVTYRNTNAGQSDQLSDKK